MKNLKRFFMLLFFLCFSFFGIKFFTENLSLNIFSQISNSNFYYLKNIKNVKNNINYLNFNNFNKNSLFFNKNLINFNKNYIKNVKIIKNNNKKYKISNFYINKHYKNFKNFAFAEDLNKNLWDANFYLNKLKTYKSAYEFEDYKKLNSFDSLKNGQCLNKIKKTKKNQTGVNEKLNKTVCGLSVRELSVCDLSFCGLPVCDFKKKSKNINKSIASAVNFQEKIRDLDQKIENDFAKETLNENGQNLGQICRNFTFKYKNKTFKFSTNEILKEKTLSKAQKCVLKDKNMYFYILAQLRNFGLTEREISAYMFPELEEIKNRLCSVINILPEEGYAEVVKNSCKIIYNEGRNGIYLNQNEFYKNIYKNVETCENEIKIDILSSVYENNEDIKKVFQEKSSFSTNFERSSPSRKNNIRVSLEKFDGLVLEAGEVLSFNLLTGKRDESSGYQKAKIITGGTFVQGFGGGVCQVSTTLYNACLLAGLEILEVHNHSLPVSYVEPSFDAMVNSGSSDLVVRNNTGGRILITTSSKNDICKFKIFGEKNKYKITRFSEKISILPAEKDVVCTDYKKFTDEELLPGEEKRLSFPKDGYCSRGYLKFYDENGVLIKTEKIRENRYNPTKGIILRAE